MSNMLIRHDLLQLLNTYMQYSGVAKHMQRLLYGVFIQITNLKKLYSWIKNLIKRRFTVEVNFLKYKR